MAASNSRPATLADLNQPPPTITNLDAHREEIRLLKLQQATRQKILDDCLNPHTASRFELEKPQYRWVVKARWVDAKHEYTAEETVAGQNEGDAWARFCDKVGSWPSRRNCREVSISKGKKIELSEVDRIIHAADGGSDDIGPRTVVNLSAAKNTAKK